jgi:hypothetical protein
MPEHGGFFIALMPDQEASNVRILLVAWAA